MSAYFPDDMLGIFSLKQDLGICGEILYPCDSARPCAPAANVVVCWHVYAWL